MIRIQVGSKTRNQRRKLPRRRLLPLRKVRMVKSKSASNNELIKGSKNL
jgi:hypothetical protein